MSSKKSNRLSVVRIKHSVFSCRPSMILVMVCITLASVMLSCRKNIVTYTCLPPDILKTQIQSTYTEYTSINLDAKLSGILQNLPFVYKAHLQITKKDSFYHIKIDIVDPIFASPLVSLELAKPNKLLLIDHIASSKKTFNTAKNPTLRFIQHNIPIKHIIRFLTSFMPKELFDSKTQYNATNCNFMFQTPFHNVTLSFDQNRLKDYTFQDKRNKTIFGIYTTSFIRVNNRIYPGKIKIRLGSHRNYINITFSLPDNS